MPDFDTIIVSILGGAASGTVAASIIDGIKSICKHYFSRSELSEDIPRRTVAFVPNTCYWQLDNNTKRVRICGHCFVTNLTKKPVTLVKAILRSPLIVGTVNVCNTQTLDEQGEPVTSAASTWGMHVIPVSGEKNSTMGCLFEFNYELPPDLSRRSPFVKKLPFTTDVHVVDAFGNNHRCKKLIFSFRP
jgi:hypothetical protein